MKARYYESQLNELIAMVKAGTGDTAETSTSISATELNCASRLEAEKQLFSTLPQVVAHSSQLAETGAFLVQEVQNKSILLVRGKDGIARAFLNYCQHRGTKLEQQTQGCKGRFSCPYHAWTYDTAGSLVGVPRSDLFPGLDKASKKLRELKLEEAHGFLWLTLQPAEPQPAEAQPAEAQPAEAQPAEAGSPNRDTSIDQFLMGLGEDLEGLAFGQYQVYFDKTRELNADWKLPLYAFLESYHIATLHKDSIANFFIENIAVSEQFGPHIRSFVPRKNILELEEADLDQVELPNYVTPTHILFPNVCLIAHPTSYTVIIMQPGATPGTCTWRHLLLVPELPQTEAARAHFDKTISVLDGMTYENEDMWASEQIQEGVNAGAIDELVLATHEHLLKVFSDNVTQRLQL